MTEDSTSRTLNIVMIIIGIVIVIILLTQGYFGRNIVVYNTGSFYTASALPFNSNSKTISNDGYPVIVTRIIPSSHVSVPAPAYSDSTGSSTTTTYSDTSASAPVTTDTYPETYPTTSYQTAPTYTSTPAYTPTSYYPSIPQYTNTTYPDTYDCPADTMECPNGSYVNRAGLYCAFTLCQ